MVFALKPIGDRIEQRTFPMRGREDRHLEHAKRLQVPLFGATDTQGPLIALYDNKQLVKLLGMIRIEKEPR